jgi:transposase InsO family protein
VLHPSPIFTKQGIAEAFVNTFRRDYLQFSILPNAATVLELLQAWMDDYNTVHPH